MAPEVGEACPLLRREDYFNPSSMYEPARRTAAAHKQARAEIARYFGLSDPRQILFTSCATESNNTAIFGAAKANPNRRHIITTAVEHPAVLEVCKELERQRLRGDLSGGGRPGQLDVGEFIRALRPDTLLVTHHARQQRDRRRSFPSSSSRG